MRKAIKDKMGKAGVFMILLLVMEKILQETIELEVRTSKGVDNGKANCYYGFSEGEEIRFFTTGGTSHFQTFNTMLRGDYTLYITCKDKSGDVAKNVTADVPRFWAG